MSDTASWLWRLLFGPEAPVIRCPQCYAALVVYQGRGQYCPKCKRIASP
jgi:hypothetical protein